MAGVLLSFEREIISELVLEDGLAILASGLSIDRCLMHLITLQTKSNQLTFVLGLEKMQEKRFELE